MQKILLMLSVTVLISCEKKYKNISEFKINPAALKDGERIKLLFAVVGESNNSEDKYYNLVIAVSEETGDTCNILIPVNHGFKTDDGDKVFNYYGPENQTAKLVLYNTDELLSVTNIDSAKIEFPEYQKVAYDSKYKVLLNNKYPAVLGFIGTKK